MGKGKEERERILLAIQVSKLISEPPMSQACKNKSYYFICSLDICLPTTTSGSHPGEEESTAV